METVNTTYREYTLLALFPAALLIPLVFGIYSGGQLNAQHPNYFSVRSNTFTEPQNAVSLRDIDTLRNPTFEDLMLLHFLIGIYNPILNTKNLSFSEAYSEFNPEKYLQTTMPKSAAPLNIILGNTPLSSIQVLGTITQGPKKWAIISAAGQNSDIMSHTVAVGDRVSQDQALVKDIVGDRVILMTTQEITLDVAGTDGQ